MDLGPEGLVLAFAAGVVSFSSPCVLPLIPGYLSLVSGIGLDELGSRPARVVRSTAAFVAGFAAMFISFGAGAAWFGSFLTEHRRSLELAAGVFIVLAGLIYAGLPLPRLLLAERRLHVPRVGGLLGATLAGVALAVGWTPCVGPTLSGILSLAAAEAQPEEGAILLGVYALGLGVPFLVAGLAVTRMLGLVGALRRRWRIVSAASGALLVVFGVLLATGELVRLTTQLARFTGWQI